MKTLTEMMLVEHAYADTAFRRGAERRDRPERRRCRGIQAAIRGKHGFKSADAPVLTLAEGNLKLGLSSRYTVGLTLQPWVTRIRPRLTITACPNATPGCIQGCVVAHSGQAALDPRIERARKAKTEFFATNPYEACFLYGWELADQVDKHGSILNRPNVGSDAEWEKILPSLTNGSVFGTAVLSYGYTKLTEVLVTDGWLDAAYRVAYSWNENSDWCDVEKFLLSGGSVAVVTSRRKGEPPAADTRHFLFAEWYDDAKIIDADLTDEWVFQEGVIGDLSAKGKARRLIGRSGFIVQTQGAAA